MSTSVFLGCYERFLFKYDILDENGEMKFERTAAHAAHTVQQLASLAMGRFVYSGGFGDMIRIFDLKSGADIDTLTVPEAGGVTALSLSKSARNSSDYLMINGCIDGSIHFWNGGKQIWKHERRITFHKASVHATDIHFSNKIAISVAKDRSLVMWDLLRKKRAFSCKLTAEATDVRFHPYQSAKYVMSYQNTVAMLSLENESAFDCWVQMAGVQDFCFWKRHLFLTAADDGAVRIWDDRRKDSVLEITDAHASRIKGIDAFIPDAIVTGASNGELKLWDLRKKEKSLAMRSLASEETDARITCLILVRTEETKSSKRKRLDG